MGRGEGGRGIHRTIRDWNFLSPETVQSPSASVFTARVAATGAGWSLRISKPTTV